MALFDWQTDPKLRFSGGTGFYSASFPLDAKVPGARYGIDLGTVHSTAEVELNGRPVDVLLFEPFVADVTVALHSGVNRLVIRVTPPTLNRMIGRARAGDRALSHLAEGRDPIPAGLLGPVRLLRAAAR